MEFYRRFYREYVLGRQKDTIDVRPTVPSAARSLGTGFTLATGGCIILTTYFCNNIIMAGMV